MWYRGDYHQPPPPVVASDKRTNQLDLSLQPIYSCYWRLHDLSSALEQPQQY
ncbi:hypothetical protein HanIR_Chr06g0268621 [Helianthus annuus]|nr:hypothetical protein HanIR_Chr06g0268621 [Helianthus annuus]